MSAFFNIDPPSATSFIEAFGINASDQIVGFYDNTQRHGFLYSGGTYTTLDVPMTSYTEADGINDLGHVVGTYQAGGKFHGYIYRNGTYATLDDPLGTVETVAQGVNNADQVVGYYIGSNGVFHGFFVDAAFGLYAPIDDPLAGTTSSGNGEGTYAQGINNAHQIVGYYVDSSHRYHGFLYANGSYFPLDFPSATATRALGINDAGQIVGAYDNASGHHGFLYANGVYTSIDDPLAGPMPGQGTYAAAGINNVGNIVGYYVDGSGKFHGFLETANPPPPAGTTADMILRHCRRQIRNLRHRQQRDARGLSVGPGRDRMAVRRPRRLLRQRHHRHAVAQLQHGRLRGLRHRQQHHHQRRLLGCDRPRMAAHGFR